MWNQIDFATVLIMLACFLMRVIIWVDESNARQPEFHGAARSSYIGEGALGLSESNKLLMLQLIQSSFAISTVLVFVRFLDSMSIFPQMGELNTMLGAMITASAPILIMIAWSAVGFGAAFALLLPSGAADARVFHRPFWYGFRTM